MASAASSAAKSRIAVAFPSPADCEAEQVRQGVKALRTHIKTKMTSLPAAVRVKVETVLTLGLVALYPTGPEAQERAVMEASAAAELTRLQGQMKELQSYAAVLDARGKEESASGGSKGGMYDAARYAMAAPPPAAVASVGSSSGADSAVKEQVKHLLKVVGERDEELMALRRMHAQLSEEFVSQKEAARLHAQDLDAEVSRLKAQLEVVQCAVNSNRTNASWDALDHQLASANGRVLQLTNDLSAEKQRVAHCVDQCKQWEAGYSKLHADANAQLQQYAQQVHTLQQQLSAATSRAGEAEHRARMAEAELAEARERMATLSTRLGESESAVIKYRQSIFGQGGSTGTSLVFWPRSDFIANVRNMYNYLESALEGKSASDPGLTDAFDEPPVTGAFVAMGRNARLVLALRALFASLKQRAMESLERRKSLTLDAVMDMIGIRKSELVAYKEVRGGSALDSQAHQVAVALDNNAHALRSTLQQASVTDFFIRSSCEASFHTEHGLWSEIATAAVISWFTTILSQYILPSVLSVVMNDDYIVRQVMMAGKAAVMLAAWPEISNADIALDWSACESTELVPTALVTRKMKCWDAPGADPSPAGAPVLFVGPTLGSRARAGAVASAAAAAEDGVVDDPWEKLQRWRMLVVPLADAAPVAVAAKAADPAPPAEIRRLPNKSDRSVQGAADGSGASASGRSSAPSAAGGHESSVDAVHQMPLVEQMLHTSTGAPKSGDVEMADL